MKRIAGPTNATIALALMLAMSCASREPFTEDGVPVIHRATPEDLKIDPKKQKFEHLMEDGAAYEIEHRPEFAIAKFEEALDLFPETRGLQSRVDSIRMALEEERAVAAAERELTALRLKASEAFSDLRGGGHSDPKKLDATIVLLESVEQRIPEDQNVKNRLRVVRRWREKLVESRRRDQLPR